MVPRGFFEWLNSVFPRKRNIKLKTYPVYFDKPVKLHVTYNLKNLEEMKRVMNDPLYRAQMAELEKYESH
jgi:hypothetical protein